ncbi:hypothetical protein BH10PSE12_BH10PSE12_16830 [soil metagenome]
MEIARAYTRLRNDYVNGCETSPVAFLDAIMPATPSFDMA